MLFITIKEPHHHTYIVYTFLTECLNDRFKCNGYGCIDSSQKCDGNNDCLDGSDEDCGKISYNIMITKVFGGKGVRFNLHSKYFL